MVLVRVKAGLASPDTAFPLHPELRFMAAELTSAKAEIGALDTCTSLGSHKAWVRGLVWRCCLCAHGLWGLKDCSMWKSSESRRLAFDPAALSTVEAGAFPVC